MITTYRYKLLKKAVSRLSPTLLELLEKQPFPCNIGELKNLIDRTILVSGKSRIDAEDISSQLNSIKQHDVNLSKVVRTLGISGDALYRRMEKYRL